MEYMVTMVVSDELRSRSIEDGASSGSEEEPEMEVDVVESGEGWRLRTAVGVGGMRIKDGLAMEVTTAGDGGQRQGV